MSHPHAEARVPHHERAHAMIARTGHERLPMRARGGGLTRDEDARQDEEAVAHGVHEHESALHKGEPKTKLKSGGGVDGHGAKQHLGRRARGGSAGKKSTHVNVIVAPQGGGMHPMPGMPAQPMAAPRPSMPTPPAPSMGAPPRPPMAAPAGAGMMPPGMGQRPPGMMQRGGGVKKVVEAGTPSENLMQARRGGKIAHRDMGGMTPAGVPGGMPPQTQPSPQQIQQIMAARQAMGGAQPMPVAGQKRGGRAERREGGPVHMEAGAGGAEGRIEKMHEYGEGGFKPKEHPGEFMLRDRKGRFAGGAVA